MLEFYVPIYWDTGTQWWTGVLIGTGYKCNGYWTSVWAGGSNPIKVSTRKTCEWTVTQDVRGTHIETEKYFHWTRSCFYWNLKITLSRLVLGGQDMVTIEPGNSLLLDLDCKLTPNNHKKSFYDPIDIWLRLVLQLQNSSYCCLGDYWERVVSHDCPPQNPVT